ncbi:MAG: hypothetical protein ABGX16_03260 [Pirellulales bacterium]
MQKQECWVMGPGGILLEFTSALGILLLSGCSKGGPECVVVSGLVTYQGKPVESGEMRFFPIEGTVAPMTGSQIEGGRYQVKHHGGVQVGTHKIEILAFEVKENKPSVGQGQSYGGPPRHQYLPPKYNKNTELKLTIDSGSGPVAHDFVLE